MSLRNTLPKDEIAALIAEAEQNGSAVLRFNNLADAKSFQWACYNLRRRRGIGKGLSFILDQIRTEEETDDGETITKTITVFEVQILRTPTFTVTRNTT